MHVISQELPVDILAVQETHLAQQPVEWARGTARNLGMVLHHGHPVPAVVKGVHGRSCGVGFICRQGLALQPMLPVGGAWRRLHAMSRLHAVCIPPRPGLPRGFLLLSVYVPLQSQPTVRDQFISLFKEVSHGLDLQIPTLLLGDFNGSMDPCQDFLSTSGSKRPACPLLAHLLGPSGAWVDIQRANLAEIPWTFRSVDSSGKLSASRIDLVLASHSAVPLLLDTSVLVQVQDGGHSPVLVSLRLDGRITLAWQRPQPRLPPWLYADGATLSRSPEWAALVVRWSSLPCVRTMLAPDSPHSAASLSSALVAALQQLVILAGGWSCRPVLRRPAYDSNALRKARRSLALLHRLHSLLHRLPQTGSGCWPRIWGLLLDQLDGAGISLPRSTLGALSSATLSALQAQKALVARLSRELRQLRHRRWSTLLPVLWQERPGVIYHWLHESGTPWGTRPIIDESGHQCLSLSEVDATVQRFWVQKILRCHASVDNAACWDFFLTVRGIYSRFGVACPPMVCRPSEISIGVYAGRCRPRIFGYTPGGLEVLTYILAWHSSTHIKPRRAGRGLAIRMVGCLCSDDSKICGWYRTSGSKAYNRFGFGLPGLE